jgi:hypothetical protein
MPDADFKGLAVIRPVANGNSKGITSIIRAAAVPWIDHYCVASPGAVLKDLWIYLEEVSS